MKLQILNLFLVVDREIEETSRKLRGFIGEKFASYPELHHHLNSLDRKKLKYEYPKIQYNVHRDKAIILGIGENNISILRNIVLTLKELRLGRNTYEIREIKAHYSEPEFKITEKNELKLYSFRTPWLALNEKNYKQYKDASIKSKRTLLKKILIGNILSASKSFEYTVPATISTELEVYPLKVTYKGVDLVGFKGNFEANFLIPDYLGLGKAVSHGYGTLKRVEK